MCRFLVKNSLCLLLVLEITVHAGYPLHDAIKTGNVSVAQELIASGIDLAEKDGAALTPLHYAAIGGHKEIAGILLARGAEPDVRGMYDMTPLMYAVGQKKIVTLLLEHRANVHAQDFFGMTALHKAVTQNAQSISLLFKYGAYIDAPTKMGYTPLNLALSLPNPPAGIEDIAMLLIVSGADVNKAGVDGMTPLHHAVKNSSKTGIIKLLLKHGAAVNAVNNDGATPLMFAAGRMYFRQVWLLLRSGALAQGAMPEGTGKLALCLIFFLIGISYCKKLFSRKKTYSHEETGIAEGINKKDEKGMTLLHYAAIYTEDSQELEYLITNGAYIDEPNNDNATPLMLAALNGNIEHMKLLLYYDADIQLKGEEEACALHYAVWGEQLEAVQFLLDHQADVHAGDAVGSTALHDAAHKGNEAIIKCLIEHGAYCDQKNSAGCTPVMFAANENHAVIVELFLSYGADISIADNEGMTSLHCAAREGGAETVAFLLSKGADVDVRCADGSTPLMLAVRWGRKDAVGLLLLANADIHAKDTQEKSAADYAREKGDAHIISLLVARGPGSQDYHA